MLKKMSMHRGVILFLILIVGLLFGLTYFEYSRQPAVLEGPADGAAGVGGTADGSVGGDAVEAVGAGETADVNETETRVPIIMYHYVREVDKAADPLGWNLSIKPAIFEEQLKWLKEQGYIGVHLKDLLDGKVPDKAVILTFDDGLEDFYTTALPLLQEYGFTASKEPGKADLIADDLLLLPRVRIDNRDGLEGFVQKMKALID